MEKRIWLLMRNAILCLSVILMSMLITAIVSGCTTTKYVPVEKVKTEYKDREVEKLITDTVRDTRFVWIKGDTILDIREKERIKRVEIHDTCYIEQTNTIREPYPVERELSKWEKVKMDFGGMAIGGIAIALCIAVVWLIKKFRI